MFSAGYLRGLTALCLSVLIGCSSGGDDASPSTVPLSGTVAAPGGTVAFNPPTGFRNMLAQFFTGAAANAALSGLAGVAGATVQLIEIDSSGNQVGSALASGTTNGAGAYSIEAPAGFVPASKYVIRALGAGTNRLDGIVADTTVDVDPPSEATKQLLLAAATAAGTGISSVTPAEVVAAQETVEALVQNLDTVPTTATALTSALVTEVQTDEEANNTVSSVAAGGVISGTVRDASNTPLRNVQVVVRDFSNWVTRARIQTDANGQYTINVPAGSYIVGALNRTLNAAASEWWTASGGAPNMFSADRVTVATSAVTADFTLDAGGRIAGTVTNNDGTLPLGGINVLVRDSSNDTPVTGVHTKADGTFRLNLRPGTYNLIVRNTTQQPYGTAIYNGAASGGTVIVGGKDASEATPIVVNAGATITTDIRLVAGHRVAGQVLDGTTAQTGIAVRFYKAAGAANAGAFTEGLRTNLTGRYRIWLQPDSYDVHARGQRATTGTLTANVVQNFTAAVGKVSATVLDASGNPVPQAKVRIYTSAGTYMGFEPTNGDGTVTAYSDTTDAASLMEIKIDNGQMIGSSIYSGQNELLAGTAVAITADGTTTALGNISLPAGGVLTGVVTRTGVPAANYIVQVRSVGTTANDRFVSTLTESDGSYSVSLPAGTYSMVRACDPANCATAAASAASVVITAGATTTTNIAVP